MAIQYPGGTFDNRSVALGPNAASDLFATQATSLAAAGWTVTTFGQFNVLRSSTIGNVAAGETVTIAARVYTFRVTVGATANEVLIGSTVRATLLNLKAAINLEAGAGTLYGSSTPANTDVVAIYAGAHRTAATDNFALVIATLGASGITVSEASALNSWINPTLGSTLYRAVSQETPGNQRLTIYFGATPNNVVVDSLFAIANRGVTSWVGEVNTLTTANGQTWRFLSHRYGFHCHRVGFFNATQLGHYAQAFYLPQFLRPKKIIGATNASPIAITTDVAHNYQTGDNILQQYVEGNTAANGTFTITVTGSTTYTLNSSTGNGTFTGTLGLAANQTPPRREVLEIALTSFVSPASQWTIAWQHYFQSSGTGNNRGYIDVVEYIPSATPTAFLPTTASDNAATLTEYNWASGAFVALEPLMVFTSLYGGANAAAAQVYGAFVTSSGSPGGSTFTADGHAWYGVWNNNAQGQLFLMTS